MYKMYEIITKCICYLLVVLKAKSGLFRHALKVIKVPGILIGGKQKATDCYVCIQYFMSLNS